MKQFNYKSRNAQGKVVSGALQAETEAEAVAELRRRGLTVVSLRAGRGGGGSSGGSKGGGSSFFSMSIGKPKDKQVKNGKVKASELVVFTRQLATMVSAGIPLVEGLEILEDQMQNPSFRRVLGDVVTDVRAGKDLSQAISRHPKAFTNIYVNMIRAAEASGQLDIVLLRLAEYAEATEHLKSEIKSAMTYPAVSLAMVGGITIFLLVVIIPRFEEMFNAMNTDLPWITVALLTLSKSLQANFLIWCRSTFAIIAGLWWYFSSPRGEYARDYLILKLPVFGPLFSKVALSRFSRTFATLIQSGVPILGALEIVSSTTGNRLFAEAIDSASDSVRQGETLGDPLSKSKVFPMMVTRMISIGERSGALEQLLEKIAEFYDQEVKTMVKTLTSLIEPAMIGIMGFLVGGMVMAIFLPIFKMIGSLSRS